MSFAAGDKVLVQYRDALGHVLELEGSIVRPYQGRQKYDWMVNIGMVVMAFAEKDMIHHAGTS